MVEAQSAPTRSGDDDISAFDAANYSYQMTDELSRMAREGGLDALADALEAARQEAAKVMVAIGR